MAAAAELLTYAVDAVLGSEAALANTAAVAGLASAVTSLVKRAVQFTNAAVALQGQPEEQQAQHCPSAVYFPVLLPNIVTGVMQWLGKCLLDAVSSSSSQTAASSALLAAVLARSIVQLADAVEAAGPQLLLHSLKAEPQFNIGWEAAAYGSMLVSSMQSIDMQHATCVLVQQQWQAVICLTLQDVWLVLEQLGLMQADDATTAAAAPQAAALGLQGAGCVLDSEASSVNACSSSSSDACITSNMAAEGSSSVSIVAVGAGSSSSSGDDADSSSSSTSVQCKWRYLLRLHHSSRRWQAAVADYSASRIHDEPQLENFLVAAAEAGCIDTEATHKLQQLAAVFLQLARTLAAAAPLPVVCNNPGCGNLAGVSEAAAASKLCSGCRCRYCSAACQAADWKRHKQACRRMAAAGEACV
jgi:hypothetical protein